MPHPRRHLPLLALILLLGAALRWIGLGERPPGAYWDEQAIAVNARLLAARGHELGTAEHSQFGHAHLIEITEHGSLAGAADPRALAGAATGF